MGILKIKHSINDTIIKCTLFQEICGEMQTKKIDLSHKDLDELNSSDIPNNIEYLNVSYNRIYELNPAFFFTKVHIWWLDLSHNELTTLTFLRCFKTLGFLDVSYNKLEIDDLFDIRDIPIVRINIQGNNFDTLSQTDSYIVPTILSHSWIINDSFITDTDKQFYEKYQETLDFGKSLLTGRRFKSPNLLHSSVAQAAKNYIFQHQLSTQSIHDVKFNPPLGYSVLQLDSMPQLDKIQYLASNFAFSIPEGAFIDYFGLTLGILSKLWVKAEINPIPKLLCKHYWLQVNDEISKMENWELFVVIYLIFTKIQTCDQIQTDIWLSVCVEPYLTTGKIPLVGSTPRLILAAFMARAIVIAEASPSDEFSDDLRAYFKYRKTCGFLDLNESIESVYKEVVSPFYFQKHVKPMKNDKIELIHPLTGNWVISAIQKVKNGRVFVLLNDIVSQIPCSLIFWDGRGIWRESSKNDKLPEVKATIKTVRPMFVTEADKFMPDDEDNLVVSNSLNFNINHIDDLQDTEPLINFVERNNDQEVSFAPKPPNSARTGRKHRKFSTHTDSPRFEAPKIEYDESKLMPGWRTFRGIVNPPLPQSQRSNRAYHGLGPAQSVKDVVNVVPSNEYKNGKKIHRYNIRVHNHLTERNHFIWMTEDELSHRDSKRRNNSYQQKVSDTNIKRKTRVFKKNQKRVSFVYL